MVFILYYDKYLARLEARLAGGSHPGKGRVEVRYNGTWGTVCDDSWDIQDANVICRMLNFTQATRTLGSAYFGPGLGVIILDDVQCSGSESNIVDCPHNGFRNHDCDHYEDTSVVCTDPGMQICLY